MLKHTPIFIIMIALFLSACQPQKTPLPDTPTPLPTLSPTRTTAPKLNLPEVSLDKIQKITWEWTELVESDPGGQSFVPDPQNYTLELLPDNTFAFRADCNSGTGVYTAEKDQLTLQTDSEKYSECGSGSLSGQYIKMLTSVNIFGMIAGDLALGLDDSTKQMNFTQARSVVTATPASTATPTVSIPEATNTPTTSLSVNDYACNVIEVRPRSKTLAPNQSDANMSVLLENTGSTPWMPELVSIHFIQAIRETKIHQGEDQIDLPAAVNPGEQIPIAVELKAPTKPGKYGETWALMVDENVLCDWSISISVK